MKPGTWLAAAGIATVAVCGLPLLTVIADTGPASACPPAAAGSSGQVVLREHPGPVGEWTSTQTDNAAIIVAAGQARQVPTRGWVIAVATAMTESRLINTSTVTDHDSIGLFQQRPSKGWGTPDQLADPVYASTKFYAALVKVHGWQTMPLTEAAQKVQRSAFPDRYAQFESDAEKVVAAAAASGNPSAIPDGLELCASICPSGAVSPNGAPGPACGGVTAVFARARSWLTAWPGGGPVPYLSSGAPEDLFGGYRRDCSGYVSMALGLHGPGLDTIQLAAQSTPISKADLQPGDLMIKPAPGGAGHVVLFERWADASMSSYYGFEQSGDGGTHYREIPYSYFGSYTMSPYRFGRS
jgi:hypothetical protein